MNKTKIFFLITTLLLSAATQLYAQDALNLNFEKINPSTHTLEHWNMNMATTHSAGYISGIDSVIKKQGKYSLFIEKDTAVKNGSRVGACVNRFPVNFKGKEIKLTGYVKTQDVTRFASIIIRLRDSNGEVTNNLAQLGKGIRGTTGWTKYSYKVPITSTTREISIVPNLMGNGKAWFDDFKLYVDGVPYDNVRKNNALK
ncbi:MAG: hypothetical protein ACRDE2_01060 [Chitinophagaceae bacterium]